MISSIFERLKKAGLFGLLFFVFLGLSAQNRWSPRDSFHRAMMQTPGFRVGFDGRNSYLAGQPVNVKGFRYGLDYGKVGLFTGYYTTTLRKINETDTITFDYRYQSTTMEYYVHQSYRFEVVTSFQLGIGFATKYRNSAVIENKTIIPAEFGLGATVRFLRYLGFYAGTGMRVSLYNGSQFTGPFYSYGFTMFTGTLYRDLKKLTQKK
jgi:hypothetical protein